MRKTIFRTLFGLCLLGFLIVALSWAYAASPSRARVAGEWVPHETDSSYFGYYVNGVQVAGYDQDTDLYRTYDRATDTWGPEQAPPWGKRTKPLRQPGAVQNFGNDYKPAAEQIDSPKPKYRLNGKPVSREDAVEVIQTGKIPDDSGKLRVTAIGAPAETNRVRQDLAQSPAFKDLRADLVCKFYPSNAWEVSKGFFTGGHPSIYVQSPSGAVLHRQDDYEGGAEAMANAIRKADPNYDPAKDSDLRSSLSGFLKSGKSLTQLLALGLLTLGSIVSRRYL